MEDYSALETLATLSEQLCRLLHLEPSYHLHAYHHYVSVGQNDSGLLKCFRYLVCTMTYTLVQESRLQPHPSQCSCCGGRVTRFGRRLRFCLYQ